MYGVRKVTLVIDVGYRKLQGPNLLLRSQQAELQRLVEELCTFADLQGSLTNAEIAKGQPGGSMGLQEVCSAACKCQRLV